MIGSAINELVDRLFYKSKKPKTRSPDRRAAFVEELEKRLLLTGGLVANNDSYVIPYYSGAFINAPGVLANDTDPNPGAMLTTHLVSGPSHASTFQFGPDGSIHYATYNTFLGPDTARYDFTDNFGYTSNVATITFNVDYSVSSTTDLTKAVAIDPLDTSVQILGSSSATMAGSSDPATADNLALMYNSVAGCPTP